jgi:hypothetical protein
MPILILDSRDRDNSSDAATISTFSFTTPIKIYRSATLIFFDLPIPLYSTPDDPVDGADTDPQEGIIYVDIDKIGGNYLNTSTDTSTFVLIRQSGPDERSQLFNRSTFEQKVNILPKVISELTVTLSYRSNSSTALALDDDYTAIIQYE